MYNEFSNTDKEAVFTCPMKCKIRGVELACTNCVKVVGFWELFLSESLTQVATFFLDLYDQYQLGEPKPKIVVYDNACNLQKFLENRTDIDSSQRLKDTASLKFVVDRLHIQEHTEQ